MYNLVVLQFLREQDQFRCQPERRVEPPPPRSADPSLASPTKRPRLSAAGGPRLAADGIANGPSPAERDAIATLRSVERVVCKQEPPSDDAATDDIDVVAAESPPSSPRFSKLDHEALQIRSARLASGDGGGDDDDDDDDDMVTDELTVDYDGLTPWEERAQRLTVVKAVAPPVTPDRSPAKLRFLAKYGLTTLRHRAGRWRCSEAMQTGVVTAAVSMRVGRCV